MQVSSFALRQEGKEVYTVIPPINMITILHTNMSTYLHEIQLFSHYFFNFGLKPTDSMPPFSFTIIGIPRFYSIKYHLFHT